ncbi:protein MAINTENANCE OF MERISTEMS-like [Camellia sinensis]|uniref:protein MAINTENANCE OF MERISTEMS-like n=1 Tax=Camellia sinensis TaxID=4442 RepID=UPI001036D323|nr:protein MAINTENANCE OF MERISTEMS-like [Camellia sinensis]
MTITLDNVTTILGLPIVGKSISVRKLSERWAIALVVNTLEIDKQDVRHEICSAGGNSVRLEWLRAHFHNVTGNDSMERIVCAGRAYLLFLLGCTLFSDKTCTRVLVVYLSLLSDLMTISSYAWGAAALAYLYRQMGYASRFSVKQLAGYMTLLDEWIYEHFRGFRPHLNVNYTRDIPHVYCWTSRRESGEETQLQAFRKELDRLGVYDVIWTRTRIVEMSIRVTQLRSTKRMSQIYQITHHFVEAGYEDSVQHPDRLYYAIDAIEQLLQDQHIIEVAPSTST